MKAIDTNVVVRFILRDDEAQAAVTDRVLEHPCFLSLTVLLECVWLLSSRFELSRPAISASLREVLSLSTISTVDDKLVHWAIRRFELGADFADMVHMIDGRLADGFLTFDRRLAKQAGKSPPLAIETLQA